MSKAKSEQIQSYEGFGNGSHGTKIYQVSSPCLSCEELIRCSNRRLLSRKSDQILLANYDKDITWYKYVNVVRQIWIPVFALCCRQSNRTTDEKQIQRLPTAQAAGEANVVQQPYNRVWRRAAHTKNQCRRFVDIFFSLHPWVSYMFIWFIWFCNEHHWSTFDPRLIHVWSISQQSLNIFGILWLIFIIHRPPRSRLPTSSNSPGAKT